MVANSNSTTTTPEKSRLPAKSEGNKKMLITKAKKAAAAAKKFKSVNDPPQGVTLATMEDISPSILELLKIPAKWCVSL